MHEYKKDVNYGLFNSKVTRLIKVVKEF